MAIKNFITNEKLGQRFDNSFSLVNYAISIARTRIERGDHQDKNMACEILEEIVDNRDLLEDFEDESDNDDETDDENVSRDKESVSR